MDFTALVLPPSYLVVGWVASGWLLWRGFAGGHWRALVAPHRLNLFLATTVVVLGLWQIRTGVKPGLSFHLYGAAALTLMFGYWRALFAGMLVLTLDALLGHGHFAALGMDALLSVALPAWVSWQVLRLVEKKLPRNFFLYALGSGFFGAALSVVVVGLATTLVMSLSGAYTPAYLFANYTPYVTLLVSWGEAFSTGMAVTLMAVYRPDWLETYDEAATLGKPGD